jgi:hypothetical protein
MQKLPLGCSDNNSMSKVYLCGLLSLYRIDSWFWWYAESSWWDLYKINSTRINMISMCSLNMWGVFSSFFCLTSKQSPEWGTMLVDCSHHSRGSILIESIRHFRYQSALFFLRFISVVGILVISYFFLGEPGQLNSWELLAKTTVTTTTEDYLSLVTSKNLTTWNLTSAERGEMNLWPCFFLKGGLVKPQLKSPLWSM